MKIKKKKSNKKVKFLLYLIVLLIAAGAFLYTQHRRNLDLNNSIEANTAIEGLSYKKELLFSVPLGSIKSPLGIKYNKSMDSYEFPAAIAAKNNKIYVADPVNYRVVVFDQNGEVIDRIKLPEKESIIDIGVDNKENVYIVNYYHSKVYIYNSESKKFKTITAFSGPHRVEIFGDRYCILDFNPQKASELRLQTFSLNGELLDTKTQYDMDLNLYTLEDQENNIISFNIIKGQKFQLAEEYEILIKREAKILRRIKYVPDNPKGPYYKNISLLGIGPNSKLYILRSVGPKFEPNLSFYQVQEKTKTYIDIIDLVTGQVQTQELEKDYSLYGPGVTSHRFAMDESGNIYQAQITKDEIRFIKYYFGNFSNEFGKK